MPLTEVTRRSVPDEVYEQIVGDVLHGNLAAGEALPSERRLAEVLGVSRPAVREALQRLAHSGVISVRQGDATTVNNFRRHAGMDLLAHLLVRNGRLDPAVARSVLEARLYIGPFVAELAARRTGAALRAGLDGALSRLAGGADPVARQRASLDYWDVIVDGADSITFRLMYNGLRGAYEPAIEALAPLLDADFSLAAFRRLTDAITRAQPAGARRRAGELLRPGTESLLARLDALEAP